MKMVKSLLLGGAAGLVAVAGAQAADLPVKAKPVQYVKICSLYGAGFYYIPGTDTCIKVGGFVRAEVDVNAGGSFNPYRAQNFDTPAKNVQTMRTRAAITLDARSQTEYGTLRAYLLLAAMNTNGGAVGGSPYQTPYSNAGFIQFAGFTAGSTASFFEFDGQPYSNITPYWSSAQAGNGILVFAYTAQFGNGLSASISAEDPTSRTSAVTGTPVGFGAGSVAGREWPDVVGNLRIDQAWGSAQIMGAYHEVHASGSGALTFAESRAAGYAFGGGIKLNAPMLGKGDYVIGQATYSKGATNYLLVNSGAGGIGQFALSNGYPVVASTALGPVFDAIYTGVGNNLDLTTGWNVTAGYEHYWSPQWRTSLYGAYGQLKYSDAASAALIASSATLTGAVGSANWSAYQIGSRTVWTPVTNLDLSVDVVYSSVKTAFSGSTTATYGTFSDKNFWAGIFRVQRNFYP